MKITRSGSIAAFAIIGTLALAGCAATSDTGSSDAPSATPTTAAVFGPKVDSTLTGTITAGGSSAQATVEPAWIAAFNGAQAAGVTINYDKSQGSGGGVTNWLSGSYDYAGSDAALKPDQFAQARTLCAGGAPVNIPAYLSGVAIIYKVDGVTDLQLSSATVAKIFTLQIKTWDDAAIKADNPKASLPSTPITVVTRSDGSGTTANFTKYLHDTQPGLFTQAVGTAWPVAGTSGQQGGSGVVNAVGAGTGTIGYADQSTIGDNTAAKVSGTGKDFVSYTAEGATEAFDAAATPAPQGSGDLTEVVDYSKITGATAYPIPLLSYLITCTVHKDPAQGKLTQAFIGYVLSTQGQQVGEKNADAASLPTSVLKQAQKTIALIK